MTASEYQNHYNEILKNETKNQILKKESPGQSGCGGTFL